MYHITFSVHVCLQHIVYGQNSILHVPYSVLHIALSKVCKSPTRLGRFFFFFYSYYFPSDGLVWLRRSTRSILRTFFSYYMCDGRQNEQKHLATASVSIVAVVFQCVVLLCIKSHFSFQEMPSLRRFGVIHTMIRKVSNGDRGGGGGGYTYTKYIYLRKNREKQGLSCHTFYCVLIYALSVVSTKPPVASSASQHV